jgi:hypothetical protein
MEKAAHPREISNFVRVTVRDFPKTKKQAVKPVFKLNSGAGENRTLVQRRRSHTFYMLSWIFIVGRSKVTNILNFIVVTVS